MMGVGLEPTPMLSSKMTTPPFQYHVSPIIC